MRILSLLFACILAVVQGCAQQTIKPSMHDKVVGGPCEGCEAVFECPVSFDKLDAVDTLPDFNDPGPRLVVSGRVLQKDGKTPAPNTVLYFYHTDQKGIYPARKQDKGWAARHGYLRGWIKTDSKGQYSFYTLRPAHYPGRDAPQHIHITVKEEGKTPYWIEEYLFADDPVLPKEEKEKKNPRAGSGIVTTTVKDGIQYAQRDIILGLNIPGY